MSKPYQFLNWDSKFFGVKVAILNACCLSTKELSDLLKELRELQAKIVYWPSRTRHDANTINKLNGKLVDIKTTFFINFKHSLSNIEFISEHKVEPFSGSIPVEALDNLAIQSGEYSRFAIDENIPKDKFIEMYKLWIKRSITREIAKEILIIRVNNFIAGMITLGEKNGNGEIGLLAVDKAFRKKKIGEELVYAAERWFVLNRYKYGHVITQGQNIPACRLYMKCGYSIKKIEYLYHFWL